MPLPKISINGFHNGTIHRGLNSSPLFICCGITSDQGILTFIRQTDHSFSTLSFLQQDITHIFLLIGEPNFEVIMVSYVNPALRDEFESLPINLKNQILNKGVQLNTLHDLKAVLEDINAGDK